jgi:hypothetical protein
MLAKETRNYMRQLKTTPMPVVATYTPLPAQTYAPTTTLNKNRKTRKNNKKSQAQPQQQTYAYVEQGTNTFNNPYYKANATGYIPALNYMSNNNV